MMKLSQTELKLVSGGGPRSHAIKAGGALLVILTKKYISADFYHKDENFFTSAIPPSIFLWATMESTILAAKKIKKHLFKKQEQSQ